MSELTTLMEQLNKLTQQVQNLINEKETPKDEKLVYMVCPKPDIAFTPVGPPHTAYQVSHYLGDRIFKDGDVILEFPEEEVKVFNATGHTKIVHNFPDGDVEVYYFALVKQVPVVEATKTTEPPSTPEPPKTPDELAQEAKIAGKKVKGYLHPSMKQKERAIMSQAEKQYDQAWHRPQIG